MRVDNEAARAYAKIYNHALYHSRKELIKRHRQEFQDIMDAKMLEQGIITRHAQRTFTDSIVNTLKQEVNNVGV